MSDHLCWTGRTSDTETRGTKHCFNTEHIVSWNNPYNLSRHTADNNQRLYIEWCSTAFIYIILTMPTMHCSSCHKKTSRCVPHQADELPVEPAQHIWSLLWFGSEDPQTGHEHGGRFLVERRLDVLNLGLCICPALVGIERERKGEDRKRERCRWAWVWCEWRTQVPEGFVTNCRNVNILSGRAETFLTLSQAHYYLYITLIIKMLMVNIYSLPGKITSLLNNDIPSWPGITTVLCTVLSTPTRNPESYFLAMVVTRILLCALECWYWVTNWTTPRPPWGTGALCYTHKHTRQ